MTDLRKAAEMALEALETIKSSCREGRTAHAENEAAIVEFLLRQALAQPEKPSTGNVLMDAYNDTIAKKKPPVKSYCGGIANYCTPVDAVNMTPDCVDETAKREHEPVEKNMTLACPAYLHGYTAPPKREWVGLTEAEMRELTQKAVDDGMIRTVTDFEYIRSIESKLKEKNNG